MHHRGVERAEWNYRDSKYKRRERTSNIAVRAVIFELLLNKIL